MALPQRSRHRRRHPRRTKAPYSLVTKSGAVFAQGEYRLTDLVGFTLGGRYTYDKKDYNFNWSPA